jgi:UDP-2-acetamido-3-amino-2,3-dideoxy-glucuronate N-acetyltransferase
MIHATAQVHPSARIADSAKIWNWVQVRENAEIGENSILSKSVYVDFGVKIGRNVKIQNNVSVYHGVTIEDGVFIGPHVCFTNDKVPRAINADGTQKGADDWEVSPIRICYGAALGANSTILPGVTVGRFAMVGAGAVVTKDVPDHGLVLGNPARRVGFVCECGKRLMETPQRDVYHCAACAKDLKIGE